MSKVIEKVYDRSLAHVVELNDKLYYIDSDDTFDHGFETMVFAAERQPDGELDIDWSDLYCARYSTAEAMEIKHNYIINHLEEFLK